MVALNPFEELDIYTEVLVPSRVVVSDPVPEFTVFITESPVIANATINDLNTGNYEEVLEDTIVR